MIPHDHDELSALAGEYVLGLLDADQSREIESALPGNASLREAVAEWQERFHPLSALAEPADPPSDLWKQIEQRLDVSARKSPLPAWWHDPRPWRWATGAMAVAAAALLALAVWPRPAPDNIAFLSAPNQQTASFVAVEDRGGLILKAAAGVAPPHNRAFELWVIAAKETRPKPLGVVSAAGELRLSTVPEGLRAGATLAVSIEPPGGSPTGLPTGPVVFVGSLRAI